MEENYLIQSKIHTRAIIAVMTRMVSKKQAGIADYHDLFHHWKLWMDLNAPMYENMSDRNRGEHLEVTLAKLRQSMLDYKACAKSLLNDLVEIISLYTPNADLFKRLYADTYGLREMMERHLDAKEKAFQPMVERNAIRREVDKELNMLLFSRGRNENKFRRELEELEDKYGITINYGNIQYWFNRSKDYYEEYDEQYKEFLSYKGRCLVAVQYDCGLSSFQIAKRIYDVLEKDLGDHYPVMNPYPEPEPDRLPLGKVFLNEDTCQSFYRSGAVECFLKNSNEDMFFQLMNLNFPDPESGLKLKYVDGLFYVLYVLKGFLVDEGCSQDWITEILEYFDKKYETYQGHYTDVIGDSENEKSTAFRLYRIVKDWLKLRK